jgi:hypothetical protein
MVVEVVDTNVWVNMDRPGLSGRKVVISPPKKHATNV